MDLGNRASWEYAIELAARAAGLVIVTGRSGVRIPVDGNADGFRVRCRFEDDPRLRPDDPTKLFFRVVEVPWREFDGCDSKAFYEHIADCFDPLVDERKAERAEVARVEREIAARAQWSPYPVGND